MFEYPMTPFHNTHVLEDCASRNREFLRRYDVAVRHFKSAWLHGITFRLLARILQRRPLLYDLTDIKSRLHMYGSHYAGIQVIHIDLIIGTEGKSSDFDIQFHPRRETSRQRWIDVAMEYLCCFSLPPVQLTQIGDVYFVRDGHHRISVARAFGQMSIDAEVVTLKASPPFPWGMNAAFEHMDVLQQVNLSR
jgi:hypothetical protein